MFRYFNLCSRDKEVRYTNCELLIFGMSTSNTLHIFLFYRRYISILFYNRYMMGGSIYGGERISNCALHLFKK